MLRRQVDCLLIDYHVCVDRIEGHELIVGGRQPKQKEARDSEKPVLFAFEKLGKLECNEFVREPDTL